MASFMNMSLDEIIRKTKKENVRSKNNIRQEKPPQRGPIIDARNTIMLKRKSQITDAREKLIQLARQKDARTKLQLLRKKRAGAPTRGRNFFQYRGNLVRSVPNRDIVFQDPTRQVVSQYVPFRRRQMNRNKVLEDRPSGARSFDKIPNIIRSVEQNRLDIEDDPMGEELVTENASAFNRKANLQLKIIAHNNGFREATSVNRITTVDKEKSPPRPTSILKKRQMAALRSDKKSDKPDKPVVEYRIIVSNLRNTVTGGDIEELFGDVGGLLESRLVRPGTAEVMYKSLEDAQRAVDLYHNRQLDGQPMNCLLVIPRSSATQPRDTSKPSLHSSNVEPDISTFHKVLFSNF